MGTLELFLPELMDCEGGAVPPTNHSRFEAIINAPSPKAAFPIIHSSSPKDGEDKFRNKEIAFPSPTIGYISAGHGLLLTIKDYKPTKNKYQNITQKKKKKVKNYGKDLRG